ncbi:protein kinase [Nonomuraea sp. NPDC059023]|uniref:protein kinase domain-containing protein n=1 Tax=unclassified Nonomuraea TaxID=2593643 RepID=UPI00369D58B4
MDVFVGESGTQWAYDQGARIGDLGGFGEVYRGQSPDGMPIAVKHVPLRRGHPAERRRREREVEIAQVLATTSTAHVMRALDVGHVNDDLFLVMPLADRSLAGALESGDLGEAARVDTLRQIAQGLVELAEISVLHRDLKPANVLQVADHWQLADFGIARNLEEPTGTYTFLGAGTMPYMAPELWRGQPATVKTDLYALGVIAYELLAGTRPFTGEDEATLRHQHLQMAPPPLEVQPALGRLTLRLLAKNPSERPQDARAVVEALDAASTRLTPGQQRLSQAALKAQEDRSLMEARQAADALRRASEQDQASQAINDLAHILEETADIVKEALPEATLEKASGVPRWELLWASHRLTIDVWPQGRWDGHLRSGDHDPLVEGGAIFSGILILGNIVCEVYENRLIWHLLRFEEWPNLRSYDYGPRDRPHGFRRQDFEQQRGLMLQTGTQVWTLQKTKLTPDAVMDLFKEAIELK